MPSPGTPVKSVVGQILIAFPRRHYREQRPKQAFACRRASRQEPAVMTATVGSIFSSYVTGNRLNSMPYVSRYILCRFQVIHQMFGN